MLKLFAYIYNFHNIENNKTGSYEDMIQYQESIHILHYEDTLLKCEMITDPSLTSKKNLSDITKDN